MGAQRRIAVSLAGIVALAAAMTGGGFVPAGAATTSPSITVTPHTGLKPGQTVTVTGKGFEKNSEVVALECLKGTTDPSTCDLGNLGFLPTSSTGAIKATFTVHRTLLDFDSFEDCLSKSCELLVSPAEIFDPSVAKPITFDPNAPLPPTSLATKPATKLLDNQTLKVFGTGFSLNAGPIDGIEVVECITAKLLCGPAASEPAPGANGRLSTVFSVRREISTGLGKQFDCAKRRGACELIALDELDVDYFATTPLAFDASVPPPPPPSLVVRPRTDLPPYARVTVTGEHWNPNDPFVIMLECAGHSQSACAFLDTFAVPDSGGAFQVAPLLEREVPNFFDPSGAPVDCAKVKAGCSLVVQDSIGDTAVVPLTFDPNAPIPPPASLSATPAPPYQDGQTITVKGKNFPPRALYQLSECAESPTEGICVGFIGTSTATTAKGTLSTPFQLLGNFAEFDDPTNCAKAGTTCFLEVDSEGGVSATIPLKFAKGGAPGAHAAAGVTVLSRSRSGWLAAATSRTAMARAAIPRPKVTSATQ